MPASRPRPEGPLPPAPLHGFALPPGEHALLRGSPPGEALAWCSAAVGPGAEVTRVIALAGGTSSAVHAVDVRDARLGVRELVLRRFVRREWLAEEPDVARREARALELVRPGPLPTPELVALDPDGARAGRPAVLMTRLPGALEWDPPDREGFLRGLAALLPAVHATPLPAVPGLPAYATYRLPSRRLPSWAGRTLWERALAVLDAPPPEPPRVLVHRDFHPGNVLWRAGRVSGVVDWVNASVGAPGADVGHCRMNLARTLGQDAADRFAELHRRLAGENGHHPYWDVAAALGGVPAEELERWSPAEQEFLAQAVARL